MLFKPLRDLCSRCNLALETSRLVIHEGRDDLRLRQTTTPVVAMDRVVAEVPLLAAPVAHTVLME